MELIFSELRQPFLCLNMIVKDESHIIKDTLIKLLNKISFDYWVISDTGSTDNTKEIILDFFKERNIKGELYQDEWKNFGYNRTKALEHAFGKSKYLLIFDADDEICGDFILPELTKDSYYLQFGDINGVSYIRTQIINNNKKWQYIGVLHEIIYCIEDSNSSETIIGNYYTISGKTSSRNNDKDKYLKDALLLENAYKETLENKYEIYNRYGFYCANSYFDYGQYEDAIKWYKITLDNNNWHQEKYISCLRLYTSYYKLNQMETGMFYLVKSFYYDKERVECLYELVKYYCCNDMCEVAYNYYKIVKDFYDKKYLNYGLQDKLFLDVSIANFFLPYYMILVADKVHDKNTIIQMYKIIFIKKHIETNSFFIGNMLYNLQFFIDDVKNDIEFINLFKEYINFLISINYRVYEHDFMIKYEKYGIKIPQNNPIFSPEECSKSNKILFYTGFSPFKWNFSYNLKNPLGGSETAMSYLSNSFPKNFEIYVVGEVIEETINNTRYVHFNNLDNLIKTTAFHTIIVSRYLIFFEFYPNYSAYQTFIWGHDIMLFAYGTNISVENIISKWNSKIKGCVCQTEWHKNLFLSKYPQLNGKIFVINNGICTKMFKIKNNKKHNRFIYSSCSERGLDRLLELWPLIIKNIPDAELFISSYLDFPLNAYDMNLKENIDKYPNIKHLGKLNREQLYDILSTVEYWLYPTSFHETSCITSLEMLMSEVICIYYPVAGLVNTLGDYGIPVEKGSEIDTIVNLTNERKTAIKKRGKEYALSCDWLNRANSWLTLFSLNQKVEKNNIRVINLKRREDRKQMMIEQFERECITNFEFVEAIDGRQLNETEELTLLFEGNNFNYRKSIIGCALSHLKIYNSLVNDNDNDYYVILEDDIELSSNFKEYLNYHCKLFIDKQLEHLSLGVYDCNYIDQEKIKTNDITVFQKDVYKFWNITFAYIISKSAAQKMLLYINKCSIKCAFDNPLSHGEVINYYHTTHCIAKQKNINEFGSDINND